MLTLMRVSGASLEPLYHDGDYVLVLHPRLAGGIKPGHVIVFRRPGGRRIMIKWVERVLDGGQSFYVVGTHENSEDSRRFGHIRRQDVIGRVVWHIRP